MQQHVSLRALALVLMSLPQFACVDAREEGTNTMQGPASESAALAPDASRPASIPTDGQGERSDIRSGDAGAAAPATQSGGTSSPSCRFSLWPNPDAAIVDYFCWPLETATQCLCNGTLQTFEKRDPANCMQSIAEFCKVDTSVRNYCEHFEGGGGGGCWPSEGENRWLCECQLGGPRQVVEGTSCLAAGQALCKRPPTACEDSTGRCKPSAAGQFSCECVFGAPALHELSATECSAALLTACATDVRPMGSQDECSTASFQQNALPSGFCTGKGRSAIDGYECQCNLPNQSVRQGKVAAASCQEALVYSCPEAVAGDTELDAGTP
jgi:hypothetical protein